MQPTTSERPAIVTNLELDEFEPGTVHRARVVMTENATGNESLVPVVVLRGGAPGPVVGVTAAVHGNELNGIPVIHRLVARLGETGLHKGALVTVPIVNIPGYLRQQRQFEDGVDLNRIMPGKEPGNVSELYAHRFFERVVRRFDYLIDLHTASYGRVNSLYIRADMEDEETARLARLIAPQIIVHNPAGDGTLRGAAEEAGIRALTVEVGNPQRVQRDLVRSARLGVQEVLEHLGMLDDISDPDNSETFECKRSYWLYTDRGGILSVLPQLVERVERDQVVARVHDIWGRLACEYRAPEAGIVVGKSTNPTARAGSRILHLGILRDA